MPLRWAAFPYRLPHETAKPRGVRLIANARTPVSKHALDSESHICVAQLNGELSKKLFPPGNLSTGRLLPLSLALGGPLAASLSPRLTEDRPSLKLTSL
ncbi:hypothetical protein FJTKL_05778 [Diaporthe vaccinii]|uniref:Uncharacterized protein n=1 Tax=Diaporthe vaccinii TaxID=105482 RepID=A0ABR4EXW2_9PEZI